ncbi:MAG: ATP-binding protein [Cyanobacteria bacterium P01_A01_bin.84]
MQSIDYESIIKKLEKTVRTLKKKLERSEADRQQLEIAKEDKELVLKGVIKDLENSQIALKERREELETALSNLKALQLKIIEAEKMSALGVMVAGIAHEINNPINFIGGNLEHAHIYFQDLLELIQLYEQHYPQPAVEIQTKIETIELNYIKKDSQELLNSMSMGVERVRDIVLSLRTFSRLDEAELKKIDIHQGIDSTLVILNHRLKPNPENSQGIELIRKYGKQLPLVECYSGSLNQVFMNIVANAIDAVEEGLKVCNSEDLSKYSPATIRITTEKVNDCIVIRIADSGTGVSEKVRAKLFDPFYTTKDIGKGTGLGLSISYQIIVDMHGGQLECNSSCLGGAEFTIKIPLLQGLKGERVNG